VVKGIVIWSMDPFEGFGFVDIIGDVIVHIVVSHDVMDRDADLTDDAVHLIVEAEVVVHDIAEGKVEPGFGSDEFSRDIISEEIDFLAIGSLGVPGYDDLEGISLVGFEQREINRIGQFPCGRDAGVFQPGWGAGGLVDMVELREIVLIEGKVVSRGFGNEYDGFVFHRQAEFPILIGPDGIELVGDDDAGNPFFIFIEDAVSVGILEHDPAGGFLFRLDRSRNSSQYDDQTYNNSGKNICVIFFHSIHLVKLCTLM
jgi:hypothetical protein